MAPAFYKKETKYKIYIYIHNININNNRKDMLKL